ncbi:hypothetical protein LCGC14_1736680 [marine sediment metagenome]|uniref:Uncharacterized protein n=1 Tax=marine sediment metagenome TaxID=412755 RepID=A0A0F9H7Y5_9ZZZZ
MARRSGGKCPEKHYVDPKHSAKKKECGTPLLITVYEYCPECGYNAIPPEEWRYSIRIKRKPKPANRDKGGE